MLRVRGGIHAHIIRSQQLVPAGYLLLVYVSYVDLAGTQATTNTNTFGQDTIILRTIYVGFITWYH